MSSDLLKQLSFGLLAAAASIFNGASLQAQEAKKLEEMIVQGIKYDLLNALEAKRRANSIVEVISSEDIGSFPDNNVADSLARLPGVSITQSFGEGHEVSVRGFGPGQNLTLLNGQTQASSGFGYENEITRGFNYSLLPAEIVSKTEVFKSPEARIPEGGVGGIINVHTRRPLAQKEPFFISGKLAGRYNDLKDKTDPKYNFLGSWKNAEDSFGALISFGYEERSLRRDALEVLGYDRKAVSHPNIDPVDPDGPTVVIARNIGTALFRQNRQRTTALVSLQFRPNDRWDFTLENFFSRMKGDNLNTNLLTLNPGFPTNGANNTVDQAYDLTYNPTLNTVTNLRYDGRHPRNEFQIGTIAREAETQSQGFSLVANWKAGETLNLSLAAGRSDAKGGAGHVFATPMGGSADIIQDIRDGAGYAQILQLGTDRPVDVTDPRNFNFINHAQNIITDASSKNYAGLDLRWDLDATAIKTLYFGVKYEESSLDRGRFQLRLPRAARNSLRSRTLADFVYERVPADLHDSLGLNPNAVTDYVYVDYRDVVAAAEQALLDTNTDWTESRHAGSEFLIDEEMTSFYAQADFASAIGDIAVRGNFGARYSDQQLLTRNHSNENSMAAILDRNFDARRPGGASALLPSVNISFEFPGGLVVRAAASKVMSRPRYTDLARTFTIRRDDDTGLVTRVTGGNPDLEPFQANKTDLSFEYYDGDASALSLALFHYAIDSFVTTSSGIGDVVFDGEVISNIEFFFPVNGDGGSIKGAEFGLIHHFENLPAVLDGLGVKLTYTRLDSDTTEIDPTTDSALPLRGLSADTYNAVLMYTNDSWNARLSYNHRSEFFERIDRGVPRFTDGAENVSGSLSYKLNDHVRLFLQGQNLTNTLKDRYIGDPGRPFQTLRTGRNIIMGANFKF